MISERDDSFSRKHSHEEEETGEDQREKEEEEEMIENREWKGGCGVRGSNLIPTTVHPIVFRRRNCLWWEGKEGRVVICIRVTPSPIHPFNPPSGGNSCFPSLSRVRAFVPDSPISIQWIEKKRGDERVMGGMQHPSRDLLWSTNEERRKKQRPQEIVHD